MIALTEVDRALLAGEHGPAAAFAMTLLHRYGEAVGAEKFIDITRAHVDGCLHHGQVSLDFVEHLAAAGGRVRVPTTLNVGSIDLIHPEHFRGTPTAAADGRRLMELHVALGCTPTFTCAPYQTLFRPAFGEHIAWAESNAIVFANSVIGARTARYGDFIDLAAAHDRPRALCRTARAGEPPRPAALPPRRRVPRRAGPRTCLPWPSAASSASDPAPQFPSSKACPTSISEDDLKALGAVAASTGSVALFHAVGITPEAPGSRHGARRTFAGCSDPALVGRPR